MKKLFYKITKKYWNILSYEHAKKNNFTVQNGVFKNLKINKNISWGRGDIASKIYGFYENKIQKKLKELKKPILIDMVQLMVFLLLDVYIQNYQNTAMPLNKTKQVG